MKPNKILIVEDSLLLHRMYQVILMPFLNGHNGLLHAYSAGQAWSILDQHPDTSLIILDTTLPGVSGFEFLRQSKEKPALQGIPVVVVTTEGKQEHIQRGLDAGAYAYVTKPFKPNHLQDLVGAIFQLRAASA